MQRSTAVQWDRHLIAQYSVLVPYHTVRSTVRQNSRRIAISPSAIPPQASSFQSLIGAYVEGNKVPPHDPYSSINSSLVRSVIAPQPYADPVSCGYHSSHEEDEHLIRLWAEVNLLRDHADPPHYARPRLGSSQCCPGTGLARMERPNSLRVEQGGVTGLILRRPCQHASMPAMEALLEMVIVAMDSCATHEGVAKRSMLMLDRSSSYRAIYIPPCTPSFLSTANSFSLTLNSTSFIQPINSTEG